MKLQDIKRVHFIGIGGISMSSLAEILMAKGKSVSGSDGVESAITKLLEEKGAKVYIGQSADNIKGDEELIVYTAAISEDNPELVAARKSNATVLDRAEFVGELMLSYDFPLSVAGTHGKTTTSSMLSQVLLDADKDPTVSIGGILPSIGGNYRVGGNKYFVLESCEYCDSFLRFNPYSAIILNVDADHLDYFKNLDNIYKSFNKFAKKLPKEGTLVINGGIERLSDVTDGVEAKIVTYGKSRDNDWYAENITYQTGGRGCYDAYFKGEKVCSVTLGVPGEHNVYNSLAVLALSVSLGLSSEEAVNGIKAFTGTKRRFEYKGEINGAVIVDDYAHHPTEIAATILSARANAPGRLTVMFQPHTYSRTLAHLDEFAEVLSKADRVLLLDIYASREKDNGLVTSKDLEKKLKEKGANVTYCPSFQSAEQTARAELKKGDMLITMGAGDVYKIGEELAK